MAEVGVVAEQPGTQRDTARVPGADAATPRDRAASAQVQSVARALDLLACFGGHGHKLTVSEIARCTDVNVSTAHRLLQTLCQKGVLHRKPDTELYEAGPMVFELAMGMFQTAGFSEAVDLLHELVDATDATATYGVSGGYEAWVVLSAQPRGLSSFHRTLSTRPPIHASAVGKAILAFAEEPLPAVVKSLGTLERLTPHTLVTARALEADLRATKARGYSVIDGEERVGLRAVGAPVFRADGQVVGAVSVEARASSFADDRLGGLGELVQEAAEGLRQLPMVQLMRPPPTAQLIAYAETLSEGARPGGRTANRLAENRPKRAR